MHNYTFLTEGSSVPVYSNLSCSYPNEIIPKFLYLGDHEHSQNYEILKTLNITHIINSTKSVKNTFLDKGIKYCRVFVDDLEKEKINYHFQKAFRFIDKALTQKFSGENAAVLVHCAQGISRSATIVAMFLMKQYDISFCESVDFLKKQRNVVEPNQGFIEQLRNFENSNRMFARSNTITIDHRTPPK